MNRKKFIETLGVLGTSTLLPLPSFAMFDKPKFKMGLQLFSIHKNMTKAPKATLNAVKLMGYEDFEIYGFNEKKETFYGLKSSEFKKILEDLEVTASSGHFGFYPYLNKPNDELKKYVDQCIKGAYTLGLKYITWPWISPEQRTMDNFKILSQKLNVVGEQVTDAGLGFAYHNHGFEFEDHNGENGYNIILKETDPTLVKLQMDMYWVMHSSSLTPKELVKNQPGRYVMWHIKDMDSVTRDYTELGNGSINYVEILPNPTASGLEFCYIEQGGNFTHNPMKSAADSATYFKKHLQQYL